VGVWPAKAMVRLMEDYKKWYFKKFDEYQNWNDKVSKQRTPCLQVFSLLLIQRGVAF
jgi:hypothetical protein